MNTPSQRSTPDTVSVPNEAPRNPCVDMASKRLHQLSSAAYPKAQVKGIQPGHELDACLRVMAVITQQPQGTMQEYPHASGT